MHPRSRPHPHRDGRGRVDRRARVRRHLPRLGAGGDAVHRTLDDRAQAGRHGTRPSASARRQTAPPATTHPPTTILRKTLTIAAGGDVIGDRDVGAFIDENGGDAVLADVAPLLRESQVAFVNLESPLSNKGARNRQRT